MKPRPATPWFLVAAASACAAIAFAGCQVLFPVGDAPDAAVGGPIPPDATSGSDRNASERGDAGTDAQLVFGGPCNTALVFSDPLGEASAGNWSMVPEPSRVDFEPEYVQILGGATGTLVSGGIVWPAGAQAAPLSRFKLTFLADVGMWDGSANAVIWSLSVALVEGQAPPTGCGTDTFCFQGQGAGVGMAISHGYTESSESLVSFDLLSDAQTSIGPLTVLFSEGGTNPDEWFPVSICVADGQMWTSAGGNGYAPTALATLPDGGIHGHLGIGATKTYPGADAVHVWLRDATLELLAPDASCSCQ